MFKSYEHFKKATADLHASSAKKTVNLSQFRNEFAKSLGYENSQAVKSFFDAKASQLEFVSVIEYFNESVQNITTFLKSDSGVQKAEELFVQLINEQEDPALSVDDIEIDACLDNGVYEKGDYQVFITHS